RSLWSSRAGEWSLRRPLLRRRGALTRGFFVVPRALVQALVRVAPFRQPVPLPQLVRQLGLPRDVAANRVFLGLMQRELVGVVPHRPEVPPRGLDHALRLWNLRPHLDEPNLARRSTFVGTFPLSAHPRRIVPPIS